MKNKKERFKLILFIICISLCVAIISLRDFKLYNINDISYKIESIKINNWNEDKRRDQMIISNYRVKEYSTFMEILNDGSLKNGDICKALGFNYANDGGTAYWLIKESETYDNLLTFKLKNSDLIAEYILENNTQINVKAIGIKNDLVAKENNTEILSKLIIKYKENICFYFPIGEYYFNQINIDDIGYYEINLYGENGRNENSSYKEKANVKIYTPDSGFINRITEVGNNETRFIVSNIQFIGSDNYSKIPKGICLGTINNNGNEYNFIFNNVLFSGYEYGFKSPGYTCGSSRGYRVTFEHCVYGMYIEATSHNFSLDTVDILYCKYGIRMSVGGNPCEIRNIHVAVGCFEGMINYLNDNPKMYAIHSKGGLIIDSIYYEQYSGELDVTNYTLIDYEGWGMGNVGKLIIKNTPIGNMGANEKGYFFSGSTFIGKGNETEEENVIRLLGQERNNYFSNGCVEFINCLGTGSVNEIRDKIKSSFNIDGGLENAFGFTFDNIELFGDGLTFTKNYKRRFTSYLIKSTYDVESKLNIYSTLSIPKENREWDGINFPLYPIFDNSENINGTHYKGSITINNIESETLDITIGIVGYVDNKYTMIRELATVNSYNKDIITTVEVDEYISKDEAINVFFGYIYNGDDKSKQSIDINDEKKIIYDIEINYDNL